MKWFQHKLLFTLALVIAMAVAGWAQDSANRKNRDFPYLFSL